MKEKFIKNQNGITLVALVITIVVLLILAGVVLNQLGQNGILDRSKDAKSKSEEASVNQENTLKEYEKLINEKTGLGSGSTSKWWQLISEEETNELIESSYYGELSGPVASSDKYYISYECLDGIHVHIQICAYPEGKSNYYNTCCYNFYDSLDGSKPNDSYGNPREDIELGVWIYEEGQYGDPDGIVTKSWLTASTDASATVYSQTLLNRIIASFPK